MLLCLLMVAYASYTSGNNFHNGYVLVFYIEYTSETLSTTLIFMPCTASKRYDYQQTTTCARADFSRLWVSVLYLHSLQGGLSAVREKLFKTRPRRYRSCNYQHMQEYLTIHYKKIHLLRIQRIKDAGR